MKKKAEKWPRLAQKAGAKPEKKYRARCFECGAFLNIIRGFSDGRVYDPKADRIKCEECNAKPKPPPPPTQRQIILQNLSEIEAAQKAGEISITEAFGLAFQNMKASVSGERVEQQLRKDLMRNPDGSIGFGKKPTEPVDESADGIKGTGPETAKSEGESDGKAVGK